MKALHIEKLLSEKFYDSQKHLVAFEVNEGTGSTSGRRIDALSMEMWPSNNYRIVGYEFKVSRSDWLVEMKQPEKSLAISAYCDEFYLIAPKGVLGIDELPSAWGYIQASEKRLTTKIKAPQRETKPMSKALMASFLRRCMNKYSDEDLLQEKFETAKNEQREYWKNYYKYEIERQKGKTEKLQSIIDTFNKETGMSLGQWRFKDSIQSINSINNITSRKEYLDKLWDQIEFMKNMQEVQIQGFNKLVEIDKALSCPGDKGESNGQG